MSKAFIREIDEVKHNKRPNYCHQFAYGIYTSRLSQLIEHILTRQFVIYWTKSRKMHFIPLPIADCLLPLSLI